MYQKKYKENVKKTTKLLLEKALVQSGILSELSNKKVV